VNSTKGLGQHVGKLMFGWHEPQLYLLLLHAVPKEVVFQLDVHGSLVEDGILGERDDRLVVDLEHHCSDLPLLN
jgi:hypothetical protein